MTARQIRCAHASANVVPRTRAPRASRRAPLRVSEASVSARSEHKVEEALRGRADSRSGKLATVSKRSSKTQRPRTLHKRCFPHDRATLK